MNNKSIYITRKTAGQVKELNITTELKVKCLQSWIQNEARVKSGHKFDYNTDCLLIDSHLVGTEQAIRKRTNASDLIQALVRIQ